MDVILQPLAGWFGIPAHEPLIRVGVAGLEILATILVPALRVWGGLLIPGAQRADSWG